MEWDTRRQRCVAEKDSSARNPASSSGAASGGSTAATGYGVRLAAFGLVLTLLFLFLPAPSPAQIGGQGYIIVAALPAKCFVGQTAFLTTAPAGSGWYGCIPANTWTSITGAQGPAGPTVYPGAGVMVSTGSAFGTSLTAPSGTIVGTSDSQTLTNKTISGAANTFSNIGLGSLTGLGTGVQTFLGTPSATNFASMLTSPPLPRSVGGTNNTAGAIAQQFFGTAAPGSVAGNLPGDLFSDTTNHNDYWCNAVSGTSAPACTSVTTGGWTLLNGGGGGSGTVTSVSSGNFSPLFNVTVANSTTTPAFSFAAINAGAQTIFSNNSLTNAAPVFNSLTSILDTFSTTEGAIFYRGASSWSALAPGTSGYFLQTQGSGAVPQWAVGGNSVTFESGGGGGVASSTHNTVNGGGIASVISNVAGVATETLANDGTLQTQTIDVSGASHDCVGTGSSTVQACTVAVTPAFSGYSQNQWFNVTPGTTSGASMSLNVGAIGPLTLIKSTGSSTTGITTGDLVAGQTYIVIPQGSSPTTALVMPNNWASGGGATKISGTASIAVGAIVDGACAAQGTTITVTGAIAGEPVSVSPGTALATSVEAFGKVTSTNTVTIEVCNWAGSTQTPGIATYTAEVIH